MAAPTEYSLRRIREREPELADVILEQIGLREEEWPISNELDLPVSKIPGVVKEGGGSPEEIQQRFFEKSNTKLEGSCLHELEYFTQILLDLVEEGYIGVVKSEDGELYFLSVAHCLEMYGDEYSIDKVDRVEEATSLPRRHIWRVVFANPHIEVDISGDFG